MEGLDSGAKRAFVPALDGMRGIAVLGVICFHYGLFRYGWTGVQLFFVLSGFLITSILLAEKRFPLSFYLRRFYWRRSLRIFPLYAAFLAIILAAEMLRGPSAALRQQWPYLVTYTFNYARLARSYIYPGYWGHLWSLSVEEQFYLVWPLLVYLLPRRVFRNMLVAIIVGTPILRLAVQWMLEARGPLDVSPNYFVGNLTPCQLDAFAAGALVAYLASSGNLRLPDVRIRARTASAVAGCGIAPLFAVGWHPAAIVSFLSHYQPVWGYSAFNAIGVALLVMLLRDNAVTRLFSSRPLAGVGKISYGVYVWHLPILALLHIFVGLTTSLTVFAAYLALTLGVSFVSYRVLEVPFLALKDRRLTAPAAHVSRPAYL